MTNLYRDFKDIFPDAPLQAGQVATVASGVARVTLPGGGVVAARGAASVGQRVFVRDGLVEGEAPNLTFVTIDI